MNGLANSAIDTRRASEHFRQRILNLDSGKLLISRLSGSQQEPDLTTPTNCDGFGRVRHFRWATSPGWPPNPLPTVPACHALGIPEPPSVMRAQVFQVAACPWRCWYCFVPYELLRADLSRSRWMSPRELIDLYLAQEDPPSIIDLSGGSPDLVPEWTVWMMNALEQAGLSSSTYLWTDDNLSSTYLFDVLSRKEIRRLVEYRNYGRVCCFKGFDAESFAFNTHANGEGFRDQFAIMRRMLRLGIDLYGYVTLTSGNSDQVARRVATFVDHLQELDANLPLRIVPLQIQVFTPVSKRLNPEREKSLSVQEEAIAAWSAELARRYPSELRQAAIAAVPLETGRH